MNCSIRVGSWKSPPRLSMERSVCLFSYRDGKLKEFLVPDAIVTLIGGDADAVASLCHGVCVCVSVFHGCLACY